MLTFLARRVLSSVIILVTVCSLTYTLLFFSSSSVALNLLGTDATPDQVAALEQELGLDQPLLVRLATWWWAAIRGDLGASWYNGQPVWESITTRFPVTLALVVTTTILVVIISVILASIAAVKRGWLDRTIQLATTAGTALPNFLIGLFLVTLFAIQLGLLPAISTIQPGGGIGPWVVSLTLPVIALTIGSTTGITQQLRSALIAQLGSDYVRTLHSRGISSNEIMLKHVMRNAAPATLTLLGLQFVGMLSGVVVIEHMFALNGIGSLAVTATATADTPLVMGIVV
jgi:peptide/nickel transport system permease protein